MSLSALVNTLLEFERSPGRWPLGRREPALLYRQTTPVLLLAAGRPVDGLQQMDEAGQARARRAARFFVRTALLHPGADPYTVLGLPRSADAEAVRTHYRLMIRLTHPDFSGAGNEWPSDAATRINLANDVLSSPLRRAELDSSLEQAEAEVARAARERFKVAAAVAPVVSPRVAAAASVTPGAASAAPSGALKMAGLALGAMVVLAGFVMINPSGDDRSLVARGSAQDALPGAGSEAASRTDESLGRYRLVATDDAPAPTTAPAEAASLNLKLDTQTPSQPSGSPEALPVPLSEPAEAAPPATERSARQKPPAEQTPKPPAPARPAAAVPVAGPVAGQRATAPARTDPAPVAALSATPSLPPPAASEASPKAVALAPPSPPPANAAPPEPAAPITLAMAAPPAPARAPRLTEVQPLLARVEQVAQRGLGIPLAMLIHPSTRNTPVTQKFIFDFQDALAGYRVAGLSHSDFNAREAGDQLDVDLRMQFNLEDSQGGYLSRPVSVRARFGRVDDKVVLVRMTVIRPGSGS